MKYFYWLLIIIVVVAIACLIYVVIKTKHDNTKDYIEGKHTDMPALPVQMEMDGFNYRYYPVTQKWEIIGKGEQYYDKPGEIKDTELVARLNKKLGV